MGGKLFENYGDAGHPITEASSVRCVLDLRPTDYSLQLCDAYESSKYGAAQCYALAGGCQGASSTNCYPDSFWSATVFDSAGYHRGFYLTGAATFGISCSEAGGKCPNTHSFTVRCVLDLNFRYH